MDNGYFIEEKQYGRMDCFAVAHGMALESVGVGRTVGSLSK